MTPENTLLKIFDNLSQPVILVDRNYKISAMNNAASALHKNHSESLVGHYCHQVTHGVDKPCWEDADLVCPVREAFLTRKRVHTIHKHIHNHQMIVEVIVATPVMEENGEFGYVVEEFQNITGLLDLRGNILSICASCKKIEDSEGNWRHIETYFHKRTGADFSHGICPDCMQREHPDIAEEMKKNG